MDSVIPFSFKWASVTLNISKASNFYRNSANQYIPHSKKKKEILMNLKCIFLLVKGCTCSDL